MTEILPLCKPVNCIRRLLKVRVVAVGKRVDLDLFLLKGHGVAVSEGIVLVLFLRLVI
jgi:hypothetical protein